MVEGADPSCVSATAKEPAVQAGRHARIGEPLPRGAIRRRGVRREGGRRVRARHGRGRREHSHGKPGPRAPDRHRLSIGSAQSEREVRRSRSANRSSSRRPIKSPEGKRYISAVKAGINCAFANRQAIAHLVRKAFKEVFGAGGEPASGPMYEVGHNNLKFERHTAGRRGDGAPHSPQGRDEGVRSRERRDPRALSRGRPAGSRRGDDGDQLVYSHRHGKRDGGDVRERHTRSGQAKSRKQALKEYRGDIHRRNARRAGHRRPGAQQAGRRRGGPERLQGRGERRRRSWKGRGVNRRVVRLKPMVCVKG